MCVISLDSERRCPPGASTPTSGCTSSDDCICNTGYWNEDNPPRTACAACVPGSATNTLADPGATTCEACEPGSWSPNSTVTC